jgi:glycosyltransferase involved in cell wall biosynthesis
MNPNLTEGIATYRVWFRPLPFVKLSFVINIWTALNAFQRLVVKGINPDVIHAHIYRAGVIGVIIGRLYRIPVVISEQFSGFHRKVLSLKGIWGARFAFRLASTVLPVSRALQRSIEGCGIKARFRVIPNVVDTSLFFYQPRPPRVKDPKRLIFVGSLVPVKGLTYLFHALAVLHNKRRDWYLDIVGDGITRTSCEQLIRRLGLSEKIAIHGFKPKTDVARLMRKADLFILTSIWDSNPCVVIEALASGLPIVATAVGGVPELIGDENGLLAKPGDPEDISDKIEKALSDLSRFDRIQISKEASFKYSRTRIGHLFQEVYAMSIRKSNISD